VLKIDQSFVRKLPGSVQDGTIVAAIIAMAVQFRVQVVAEGIETPEQLEALRRMQCAEGQGFLFSAAVPAEEFARRLSRARP